MRLRVSQQRWLRLMLGLDFGPGCSNLGLGARSNEWSTEVGFGWLLDAMLVIGSACESSRTTRKPNGRLRPVCTSVHLHGALRCVGGFRQTREHDARGACTQLRSPRWMQPASARVDRECRLRPVGFVPLAGRWVLRISARWWPNNKRVKAAVMRYGYRQGGFFEGCEPRCGNGFAIQPPVGRLRPCGAENGA